MSRAELALQPGVGELYREHHNWLVNWLRRKLGCPHTAADTAHDIFVRIIGSRDALMGLREPRAYLTTTATRLLIDRARRHRIEQAWLAELSLVAETIGGYPSPEQTLMAVQALEQISVALEHVHKSACDAFLLHYLEGETHATIATHLGVSTRTVQKYLVMALAQCDHACEG